MADVARDGPQGFLAGQLWHDALAIVSDHQSGRTSHAAAFNRHPASVGIQ
jgi:hypothetical protein